MFSGGRTLSEGVALCDEYGAYVIGVVSDAPARVLVGFAKEMASSTTSLCSLMFRSVAKIGASLSPPMKSVPHCRCDIELVVRLRAQGVHSFEHRVPPPQLIRVNCSQRLAAVMFAVPQ